MVREKKLKKWRKEKEEREKEGGGDGNGWQMIVQVLPPKKRQADAEQDSKWKPVDVLKLHTTVRPDTESQDDGSGEVCAFFHQHHHQFFFILIRLCRF